MGKGEGGERREVGREGGREGGRDGKRGRGHKKYELYRNGAVSGVKLHSLP